MTIAMVHGRADPGRDGVADYTAHLVDALCAAGVEVVSVPTDPGLVAAMRTARRLRALRPALVHVQFAPSAYGFSPCVGLLPDVVGAPVVTTLHEYGWWAAPSWLPGRRGRPSNDGHASTARRGGSPPPPPLWSRRTPGTPPRWRPGSAGRR